MDLANHVITGRGSIGILLLATLFTFVPARQCAAQGRDGGDFDGAVWRYSLAPRFKGHGHLKATFRVNGRFLYQKETPADPDYTKVVGKKLLAGKKKVRIEFTDVRAWDDKMVLHEGLKGSAGLSLDRYGNWSGVFIDGEGRHWDMKCVRTRE